MGAYMNALREEGSKEEILEQLEAKMDEIERLQSGIKRCAAYLEQGMSPELVAAHLKVILSGDNSASPNRDSTDGK